MQSEEGKVLSVFAPWLHEYGGCVTNENERQKRACDQPKRVVHRDSVSAHKAGKHQCEREDRKTKHPRSLCDNRKLAGTFATLLDEPATLRKFGEEHEERRSGPQVPENCH